MNNIDKIDTVVFISTIPLVNGNTAGASRIQNYTKALASENIYSVLLTPLHKFNKDYSLININEKTLIPSAYNLANKRRLNILTYIFFFICIYKLLKKNNRYRNCVFFLYPSNHAIFDFISIIFIKMLFRKKLFCEINELRKSYVINRIHPKPFLKRISSFIKYLLNYFIYALAENIVWAFNGIIVISSALENYFIKINKNLIRIPIICDINNTSQQRIYLKKEGGILKLGFFGSIRLKKEGFDVFFEALGKLYEDGFLFALHLYGPINEEEKDLVLKILPIKYHIESLVHYHGVLAHDTIITEMSNMDILILPRPENLQTKYGFSTKLAEYLTSGTPVLVTNVSDNGLYIKDGVNGFIINKVDSSEFYNKLKTIYKNYNVCASNIGKNGFTTARNNFDYRLYSKTIADFLTS